MMFFYQIPFKEASTVSHFISTIGFPVFMALLFCFAIYKLFNFFTKRLDEEAKATNQVMKDVSENISEATINIHENTKVLNEMSTTLNIANEKMNNIHNQQTETLVRTQSIGEKLDKLSN